MLLGAHPGEARTADSKWWTRSSNGQCNCSSNPSVAATVRSQAEFSTRNRNDFAVQPSAFVSCGLTVAAMGMPERRRRSRSPATLPKPPDRTRSDAKGPAVAR